jgi:site-specific DNA recombinase
MSKPIVANGNHPTQATSDATKIAAIYARVSTTDQADKGYSLPTQLEACQTMAWQEGYTVPDTHVFVDDYTGTSLNRPQFTQLRDLVRQRLVQAVFVHDLDRLSRKLAHQLLLSEEFDQASVALRIVTMPDGAKTPEAQLLNNVRGIIAEYERAKILERTARGRRGRAQAGHVPYGRRTLGYTYVKHAGKGAHYEAHPEEAALVQRIFRLYVEGERSTEGIAALLTREGIPTPMGTQRAFPAGVWHPATIAHLLRNTTYIGTLYDGKKQRVAGKSNPDKKTRWRKVPRAEWVAIAVPPIIDIETFEAAQARLTRQRQQSPRNRKHGYLLVNGRLRCGQCGRAMGGSLNSKGRAGYRCFRPVFQDTVAPHIRRSVQAAAIEPVVWDAVERALNNPALIAAELERRRDGTSTQQADLDRERQHYTNQLAQCDKDLKRWEAAYLGEAIDLADFKAKKAEVDTRRASAEQELARLDDQQRLIEQAELDTTSLMDYCARVRAQLQHFTLEEKRQALEMLNITVTWHPEWPTHKIEGSLPPEIFAITTNASKMNPVDNMLLAQHRQQGCFDVAALRMGQAHTVRHKVRVDP